MVKEPGRFCLCPGSADIQPFESKMHGRQSRVFGTSARLQQHHVVALRILLPARQRNPVVLRYERMCSA